jgi:hypothetical protein
VQTGHRNSPSQSSFQRPTLASGAVARARHFNADPALTRGRERYVVREIRQSDEGVRELRRARYALYVCAGLMIATTFGSVAFLYGKIGSQLRSQQQATVLPDDSFTRGNFSSMSVRAKNGDRPAPDVGIPRPPSRDNSVTPAEIIARGFATLEPKSRQASSTARGDRIASASPQEDAAPEVAPRPQAVTPPRNVASRDAKTVLVDFETAPFPYNGNMPNSEKRFLDRGEGANRGHTNFRGRVLKEATVFNDRRALLHIPQGFDANKPGVIVVFFHGHGANLADDVRDRQQVPAQISASGVNAVMVAPQFAVNAADSSSGKFWEKDGFRRFMDESAAKFAKLSGDPKSARAFAKMPIVIVAYSGGFGPTLSVLDRGGVDQRIRGIVLLDALYTGMDKFADWIAANRSSFFVSSYTPHTRGHNVELEGLLDDKSISYGSELRPNRLPGSVTFLPAGDISHRDFVNHAWADSPIKDILVRLDEARPNAANVTDSNSRLFVARR